MFKLKKNEQMEDSDNPPAKQRKPETVVRKAFRTLRRCFYALCLAIATYLVIVAVGLIPVNNGFRPTADGIKIYVVSNPVHADIVLPMQAAGIDWRHSFPTSSFSGDTAWANYVAIGWGDKGFYLETPTWSDMKLSTAANALLVPSSTCLHVGMYHDSTLPEDAESVTISEAEYRALVEFINKSFKVNEGGIKQLIAGESYGRYDAFYEANGNYSCFNTCNCWVGNALESAGIRTGWFTPLPKTVTLYFPSEFKVKTAE